MEADWDVEIGPDAPSIAVPWPGFVDLRNCPSIAVPSIPETANHPALRDFLVQLNSAGSPVFTSKCDIWTLGQEEIDHDEFGARPENARFAIASYIDILLLAPEKFGSFRFHEAHVRRTTKVLRDIELANCRVDMVVRSATVQSTSGYGLTLYTAGCGADEAMACTSWEAVLQAALNATMNLAHLLPLGASSSIG
ncbi:MAG: hypothetical protein JOZ33_17545 [Acidobacteriaceae bacterium]|nr:hypothetical protein [Acidobacteriaceae bacterium]